MNILAFNLFHLSLSRINKFHFSCCYFALFFSLVLAPEFASAVSNKFEVKAYGAIGDGKTIDTKAINQAIQAANRAGGGTVYFAQGDYLANGIILKSNVTLEISKNAKITAAARGYNPPEKNRFDLYQSFGQSYFHNSLILAEDARHIAIVGPGQISARNLKHNNIVEPGFGNKVIALRRIKHFKLRDVTIDSGGYSALTSKNSDNLVIERVTIKGRRKGISLIDTRGANINQVNIKTQDDAVSLISDYSGGIKSYSENIVIRHSTLESTCCHAIHFGPETAGNIKNILFEDIQITSAGGGGIALSSRDGAHIENLVFRDIQMSQVGFPIAIESDPRKTIAPSTPLRKHDKKPVFFTRTPKPHQPGKINNVNFEKISIDNSNQVIQPIRIIGNATDKVRISNVRFFAIAAIYKNGSYKRDANQAYIDKAQGININYAQNITLDRTNFTFDENPNGHILFADDVVNLYLNEVKLGKHALPANKKKLIRIKNLQARD